MFRIAILLLAALVVLRPHALSAEDGGSSPLEESARRFVDMLAEGEYEKAAERFDETMRGALPPATLKQVWETLVTQAGPLERQGAARAESQAGFDIVYVTLEFERAALDAKVVFDREGRVTGLWFVPTQQALSWQPPAYAKRDEFIEREVTVGEGEWVLPATLTLPKGEGPFPAVVLVHGSGPHDRDETIGPNKPFKDLAWGLASRGVAVLRYEKRTKQYPERLAAVAQTLTVKEETVDDALAAVETLRGVDEVDPVRVYVLGHSLGGMLIPRIGARDDAITGFIVLAGTTRPLAEVILEQVQYIAAADGTVTPEEKAYIEETARKVELARSAELSPETPAADLPFGIPPAYWLDLRGYDAAEAAKAVERPMLVLQGERDYQVTMEDYAGWQAALAGREDVTLKSYPSLNHLFMETAGASRPSDYQRPDHVSAEVIVDIARWIARGGMTR